MSRIRIICIVGTTASGKTGLGVSLAEKYNGEVVSADSMQIYKGISIASAAPDEGEKRGIKHHLLEFLEINDSFSAADFAYAARKCIADIHERGKTPIVVGGTGLYISALTENTEFCEAQTDLDLRARLERELESKGAEKMLERLARIDPETAEKLHPNNRRRIIRAFEIYETTGHTMTEQNARSHLNESPYDPVMIGLTCRDRAFLYDRINRRVDLMLEKGLADEARKTVLLDGGRGAAQAIGHKELYPYLRGEKSLSECTDELKRKTRNYAKRQLTWFGRDAGINWIYIDESSDITGDAVRIIEEKGGI